MRRILLTATWLAGTLIATGVVYAAVSAVAGQVTEHRSEALSHAAVDRALQHTDQLTPSPSQPAPSTTPTAPTNPTPSPPAAATPGPTGQGPTNPPPRPATTDSRTFALVGGTASVRCAGDQITLNWATPNSGYQVETGSSNGGAQIEVRFRSDTHESRLEAWCAGGLVQSSIREESA